MGRRSLQEVRKEEIAKALFRCLLRKPFAKTSIKDIAGEAGMNHGMLHYYFKSKEDLLLYFLDWIIDAYINEFRKWADVQHLDNLSRKESLSLVLDYAKTKITLNEELSALFIEIWAIALYNTTVKKKLQQVYKEWIDELSAIVGRGGNERDAMYLSLSMVAFFEGISLFHIMLADIYPVKESLNYFEEEIESFVNK